MYEYWGKATAGLVQQSVWQYGGAMNIKSTFIPYSTLNPTKG